MPKKVLFGSETRQNSEQFFEDLKVASPKKEAVISGDKVKLVYQLVAVDKIT